MSYIRLECGADDDCAMKKWLRLFFVEECNGKVACDYYVELSIFLFALQNGLEKVLFTATFGMPHRANGDCDVTESYLK